MDIPPHSTAAVCSTRTFLGLCEAAYGSRPVIEGASITAPQWRRVGFDQTGLAIAHVGVRAHRDRPEVELCGLMVHPDWRRQRVATRMVDLAVARFGMRLRASVDASSPGHLLLLGLGWADVTDALGPRDAGASVRLACVEPHRRLTR